MLRGSFLMFAAILAIALPARADMVTSRPAAEVTPYQAQTIQPYHATTIQPYRANGVPAARGRALKAPADAHRLAQSHAGGLEPYHAHTIHRLTLSERHAMERRDMAGYHGGSSAKGRMTEAQIKAYGALNHNLGVWNSGQDFTMQGGN